MTGNQRLSPPGSGRPLFFLIAFAMTVLTSAHATFDSVPIRDGGRIQFVWVGDLTGDGNLDWVLDRPDDNHQRIEAYTYDGQFLWEVNFGPNSVNKNNISPGSATISVGHWDGVTVGDLNDDGTAEVVVKIANGVTFGDGNTWNHNDDDRQWIGVLDGATGALLNYSAVPTDYLSVGPMAAHMGIGNIGIVVSMKNRNPDGSFNMMISNYKWSGNNLTRAWTWHRGSQDAPDGHQMRIVDVNEDGIDDVAHIGFVLDGSDGSLLYSLGPQGVVHGDRFHIAKMDPDRPGLQGWGVQQNNPSGLLEYYYDARDGTILWTTTGTPADVGRGDVGNVDPNYPGYEAWSFYGMKNAPTNTVIASADVTPWPSHRLWWTDDNLSEQFNDGKIERWNYQTQQVERLVTTWHHNDATRGPRGQPMFYGDIAGDWREEVVLTNSSYNELLIFNPPGTSNIRPSLRNDQYYRNCLTIKGYTQSHHTSFFIGTGGGTTNYDRLRNRATDMFIDGMGRTANGSDLGQWANTNHQNAHWEVMHVGDYRKFRNRSTGLFIDGMGRTSNGSTVGQWSDSSSHNQQWLRDSPASGWYRFQNRATGLYLDGMGRTDNGADVGQWANTNHHNAQWEYVNP